ncbi:hypothetical protein COOONC_16014 [Cooperia oncophora]
MLSGKENTSEIWKKTVKALKDVKSSNVSHLQKEFLSYCRQFRTYGSTFFIAEVYMSQRFTRKPYSSDQSELFIMRERELFWPSDFKTNIDRRLCAHVKHYKPAADVKGLNCSWLNI